MGEKSTLWKWKKVKNFGNNHYGKECTILNSMHYLAIQFEPFLLEYLFNSLLLGNWNCSYTLRDQFNWIQTKNVIVCIPKAFYNNELLANSNVHMLHNIFPSKKTLYHIVNHVQPHFYTGRWNSKLNEK